MPDRKNHTSDRELFDLYNSLDKKSLIKLLIDKYKASENEVIKLKEVFGSEEIIEEKVKKGCCKNPKPKMKSNSLREFWTECVNCGTKLE